MSNLQKALDAYKNGDLIIVTDDADRENEGDLINIEVDVLAKYVERLLAKGGNNE